MVDRNGHKGHKRRSGFNSSLNQRVFELELLQNYLGTQACSQMGPKCVFFFFPKLCLLFFFFWLCSIQDLSSQPGIEPRPPALEVQNLNHCTAREVTVFLK